MKIRLKQILTASLAMCSLACIGYAVWSLGKGNLLLAFTCLVLGLVCVALSAFFHFSADEPQYHQKPLEVHDGWGRIETRGGMQPISRIHTKKAANSSVNHAHPWAANMKR